MSFSYDQAKHHYEVDGRRIISNTDVLKIAGLSNLNAANPVDLHFAAEIGNQVHAATLLHDQKKGWQKEYGHVAGYVAAWIAFSAEYELKPLLREYSLYDPIFNYATTVDCFAMSNRGPGTFQIKTVTSISPETAIQTAAEEHALIMHREVLPLPSDVLGAIKLVEHWCNGGRKSSENRWAVQLFSNGQYIPHRFEGPYDIIIFTAALTVAQWLVANGKAKY